MTTKDASELEAAEPSALREIVAHAIEVSMSDDVQHSTFHASFCHLCCSCSAWLHPKQQQLLLLLLLFLVSSLLQVCKPRWPLWLRPALLQLPLPPPTNRRAYPPDASPCRTHPLMRPLNPQLPLLHLQFPLRGDPRERDSSACRKTLLSTPFFSSDAIGSGHTLRCNPLTGALYALPPLSPTSTLPLHHR